MSLNVGDKIKVRMRKESKRNRKKGTKINVQKVAWKKLANQLQTNISKIGMKLVSLQQHTIEDNQ